MTEVTAKVELKPCPFCGGPANADPFHQMSGKIDYYPQCKACDFSLDAQATEAEAAEAWNRRDLRPDDALRTAAGFLLAQFDKYRESDLNHECAHRFLARFEPWETLRAALNERNPDHDK